MKESIRRIVMLCTILTFGLILIFFDVTLVQLFLMMVVLVIVLPFLLGIARVAEVRTALQKMKKTGILKRLDEMKFFEKSTAPKVQKALPKTGKAPQKPAKTGAPKAAEKKGGLGTHLKSMVSSLGSLGSILKERSKRQKKVEDINKMLDRTVTEKVTRSPAPAETPGRAGGGSGSLPAPGGAGSKDGADPFLSLSNDEFDDGLLDGLLDGLDDGSPLLEHVSAAALEPGSEPASTLPEPELSMPSVEGGAGAPADAAAGAGGFSGPEGGDAMDAEFGDLDNLSLDDVELDEDTDVTATPAAALAETSGPATTAPAAAPPADSSAIKTAWIPSDAPRGADQPEDQLGMQSDMASFAGGAGGTDEDLLSSIASDVKHVKTDKDVSLLRELKDFKAPASEIEDELQTMYQKIGVSPKKPGKGIK
jgi:Ca2+/Na+ antiporter